ncbi:MAG TPA: GYD domain-containing protein [Burkholderiales bacterium]|nr:GYD domain-containing protein [Burkholderiales bacterium]
MPKYLIQASYTLEGLKGVMKTGGSARRAAVQQAVESAGGKLEAQYFALGDYDAFAIVDLPDHVSAAACSLAVSASGAARTKSTALLTPEEVDQAVKKQVKYRPPNA